MADAATPLTFVLSKPIPAYGEDTTTLTFQEPSGLDLIEVGNPVVVDTVSDPALVRYDMKVAANMISRLAKIPLSSVARMAPNDLVGCCWLLAGFFVPASGVAIPTTPSSLQ